MGARKWTKKETDLLVVLPHPKYKLWTIKGNLIESGIVKRYMKFRHTMECHTDFKLDDQSLNVVFKAMEDAIDNNRVAEVSQWIGVLRALKDLTYWENELFEVANCFIFLENEPLDDFDLDDTLRKRQMFNDDPELKLFFCQFGHEYLRHLSHSETSINVSEYLDRRQSQIAKSMYDRLILPKLAKKSGTD